MRYLFILSFLILSCGKDSQNNNKTKRIIPSTAQERTCIQDLLDSSSINNLGDIAEKSYLAVIECKSSIEKIVYEVEKMRRL